MEEELNENELEERFYSMLHYVDDTQANVTPNQDALKFIENAPRSTVRRYWRTSGDHTATTPINTPFQKVNIPKEAPKPPIEEPKPKQEKSKPVVEPLPKHLALFDSPVPKDVKKTIKILENDDEHVVELESSDEDEVIEVALPPKPTITIESSDDEICIHDTPTKNKRTIAQREHGERGTNNGDREISASPVPSIVSSVSDDFIRGDCIAFNISSRRPDNHSFDFSLHGADILGSTPSKKKKKKKNKESAISTPITVESTQKSIIVEECFATPKSKAKNKKQKNKSYVVTEKSIPNPDVYDSDSNQSIIDVNKNHQPYTVNEKSLPCADVYETDSNPSETIKPKPKAAEHINTSDSSVSPEKLNERTLKTKKDVPYPTGGTIDLTKNIIDDDIQENIVIGNVTGFNECEDYNDECNNDTITADHSTVSKFGSTKVPAILFENLDFDNLKGKEKVCKNRRYSLTTLRAEMEKFYNESWGGEDFNHREILQNMSRDKSLWAIDPKDKMATFNHRKKFNGGVTCNYCNRVGHRDDTCRLKPRVCFMCGNTGHMEPRCPNKICVNCGAPNHVYSTMCRNCSNWSRIRCAECGQWGHPSSHCPDLWRRYHNTVDITQKLEENGLKKKTNQQYCSGCTRRGHLIHACRVSLPFSGLTINSPYVHIYRPLYTSVPETPVPNINGNNQENAPQAKNSQDSTISSAITPSRNDRCKRPSKSPTVHEAHVIKKRNISLSEITEQNLKNPLHQGHQRKSSQSKEPVEENNVSGQVDKTINVASAETTESAPDFIPIVSSNHDKKGQVIQDNEVSNTSDVITSARVYVTAEVINRLKTEDGINWLKEITDKLHVSVETDNKSFLSIKGKVEEQESFQTALRDWATAKSNVDQTSSENEANNSTIRSVQQSNNTQRPPGSISIPKQKNEAMRILQKALQSLNQNLGEPNLLYKQFHYLKKKHQRLQKLKVVSPKKLANNKKSMNSVLKKLNTILLGQAGLAGGKIHIDKLYKMQEKLVNQRMKKISPEMLESIDLHYNRIFTSTPRHDYGQLLKSYNTGNHKKHENKTQNLHSQSMNINTIPARDVQNRFGNKKAQAGRQENRPEMVRNTGNNLNKGENVMKKLAFFQKRLLRTQTRDIVLKDKRNMLVKKLQRINSLSVNPDTSSKDLKKMTRKIQHQVQVFLNAV